MSTTTEEAVDAPASIEDVADYILSKDTERGAEADVTVAKLECLLYLAQAWHLACSGRPLFDEPCLAYPEGPGFASVRRRFADVHGVIVQSGAPRSHGGFLPHMSRS